MQDTTDFLYSYKRKTTVNKELKKFKFEFEFDLDEGILELDLADMIMYCCQRDIRLQKLLQDSDIDSETSGSELLKAANKYRKLLAI